MTILGLMSKGADNIIEITEIVQFSLSFGASSPENLHEYHHKPYIT